MNIIIYSLFNDGRSQWPRRLRHEMSSPTGIVGSNPTRGMSVCVYSVSVLHCESSGLATELITCTRSPPTVYEIKESVVKRRKLFTDTLCSRGSNGNK
jgi:hypothetical protein